MVTLRVTPWRLAVAQYQDAPEQQAEGEFWSLTRTPAEWSLVCESDCLPAGAQKVNDGWRCLEVAGPLDFALTGILSGIAQPLAEAKISIFALSTFDTDYVLVKEETLASAIQALTKAGFAVME